MKTLFLILSGTILFITNGQCQNTQSENISNLKSDVLNITTDYLDVDIKTWEKDHIEIQSQVKINLGNGNDNHELQVDNTINGIEITSSIDIKSIDKMVITTDKEGNKSYTPLDDWDENNNGKGFSNMNFGYEINGSLTVYVPKSLALNMKTVYGDVFIEGDFKLIEIHSTYGLVEAKLDDVSNISQINLKSTYDIIDLTLDKNSDASLNLQTSYGSVFTNLPLQTKQATNRKRKSNHGCNQFSERYVLNNGDTNIDLVATYDNIYVRSN